MKLNVSQPLKEDNSCLFDNDTLMPLHDLINQEMSKFTSLTGFDVSRWDLSFDAWVAELPSSMPNSFEK